MESKVSETLEPNSDCCFFIEQLLRYVGEHLVHGTGEPVHAFLENVSKIQI